MKLTTTLTAILLLGATAPTFSQAFSEDFEGITTPALPADWANVTNGAGGWKTNSGQIAFISNWRIPAHTKYAVVNDYNDNGGADVNNPSRLTTPLMDLATVALPVLEFEYYFANARTNTGSPEFLIVEASVDTGKTWTPLDTISDGNTTQWQERKVSLAPYANKSGIMIAFKYSDMGNRMIGAAIDDIEVIDYPKAKDAVFQAVTPDPSLGARVSYGLSGNTIILGGTIYNDGATPITSLDVSYQVAGGAVVTDNITGLNIAPFRTGTFSYTTPYTFSGTVGEYVTDLWLGLAGDADATNDSAVTSLFSVMSKPKKKILAEEGTGTWCGWCPRGHVYMDSVANSPTHAASFSLIAVHNADPMVVAAYDSKIGTLIGGYPSMTVDRMLEVDPSALFSVYTELKDFFGFADITLTNIPSAGFTYSVKASVTPAIDLSGDYRLALVLTEDDVKGEGSGWAQTNYYSYQSQNIALNGSGLDWRAEPGKVPAEKMRYNHVARGIFPNPNGAAGSLPASMTAGTTYDYTFNVQMNPIWHRYGDLMHATVMLIRNSDGEVLNSNNITVPVGIENTEAGISAFTVFPNPANDKAVVNFSLANASDVDVVVTDMMGRTVQVVNKSEFTAGKHQVNINLSNVAAGVYNVSLKTDNGTATTRLSVVK